MRIFISILLLLGNSGSTLLYSQQILPETPINHLQFFGSHNSYRLKTYDPLWNELKKLKHPFSKLFLVKPWNYSHTSSLDSQLTVYGLRSLELDIYHDPTGGRFYSRKANKMIGEKTESGIADLKKPGLKVMHVPDFDYQTHHYLFTDALKEIKNWSEKNPNHEPLFIMVEMKELHFMKYFFPGKCTKVLPFTKNAVDSIDLEIETVFGKNSEMIFTPDEMRGNFATLNECVLANSWPTLEKSRGKIFFILQGPKTAKENYLKDHYTLKGRTMFIFSDENKPETAFILKDNPKKMKKEIVKLVKKGYMVRGRTDEHTREARKEKYKRYDAAFESGAQIICSDYYAGDKCLLDKKKCSNYKTSLPDGNIIRLNPIFLSDTIKK